MSNHLNEIIERHNSVANLQVVFVDIEKYSQRRTQSQVAVIECFTKHLKAALSTISANYVQYAQRNNINMSADIVRIPTGDGAAIVFSFDGLHDIHLTFALALLQEVHASNIASPCDRFETDGWCNCHTNYYLRTGINEGRGIIFQDINGSYNAAGAVLNNAARVMGRGDRQQVLFTESAYEQIVDMIDDVHLADRFQSFPNVAFKHGLRLTIYQYIDGQQQAINSDVPNHLVALQGLEDATKAMAKLAPTGLAGIAIPDNPQQAMKLVQAMLEVAKDQKALDTRIKGLFTDGQSSGGGTTA